ncbi:MAG: EmrB/QacA family drug resistance transporter [Deltaproteobacteria bacterium 13_1_20CM_2_69_21]|nr:MAG: EmrB/QacA family drug resistance transporter [Deltaproteobacteria bacterium 13_1_40CM_4_68_19]OLD08378.1 MAG: EmrB/QacA family drug resistance transporter [Deltaproteobacteria bacterium 13_1_40CM_3_69_14]OLD48059.1 MAG: EmrB/QacA family drug resistance transporter [Chloroflexi bacterium 13_1_40CM_2_68_14]OLE63415.1 MAG: EmrB/QacA family drug resistance transporter [Deltaproteobacteria bacterium 13_1_20CM_2_69_21]
MTKQEAPAISGEESLRITHERGWTGGHNPWTVALVVTMATFMEVLDTAIANVSLPHIAGSLSASIDESTWVLTSYLVSNAVVLPISGWLATRIGRKRFYLTCVVLFTVSSLLCGLAPNLGLLVFFRVLQGLGGGGLAPSEQAILADTFPPQKRGMAFAVYGMAVVMAPAIGPTLGGFITDHYSWRWVFFINVPVGIASLLLSSRVLVDPPHLVEAKKRVGPIDSIGLGLIAVGLGALEYVLDKGQEEDWFNSHTIVIFSAIAAVSLVSFVLWEWRQEHPVVEVRLFKNGTFAVSSLMMLVLGMALYGSTVLLPQYLQVWMGYSAQDAGMVLSPGGVTVILLLPIVGRLISKVDSRYLIAFGFLILSAALFHMAHTLYPGIDFRTAVLIRMYQSCGLAFLFVPINTLVYSGVPPQKNNQVSGIVNLARNMGGDIGISLVTTLIARRSQFHQARLVDHVVPSSDLSARLSAMAQHLQQLGVGAAQATKMAYGQLYGQVTRQAQTLAYLDALLLLSVFTAIMVPAVLLTRKARAGAAAMGH